MDRGHYMLFFIMGMLASLAVFLPLGAKRRVGVPSFVWWICLGVGIVANFYGLSHSTAPSLAPRITAIGKVYNHVEVRRGRDTHYGYDFVTNVGEPIHFETSIIIPGWGNPEVLNRSAFRIVYLQSPNRDRKNEAISIEILSGRDAGFHDFVDARVGGAWLTIPIGAAIASFGYLGLRYMKDDEKAAWDDTDEDASKETNPLDIDLFK
jgi:hypothetical protein